ncbi:MAG: tRNA glutamyl-Q(34) synthetase GluQRS [Verrucomicrobia bacterium]|nr:tRNA glutamyl-Q(34) synthetase GluQRS [Verrucomicrobiota bacterium]
MDQGFYRGRLAPSPTGYLHLGHARTFWVAHQRARVAGGVLVLRNEDLDPERSRREYVEAMLEDLRWLGMEWQEGPDCGGPYGPYEQSQRHGLYEAAFEQLRAGGWVYPCVCSRKDVQRASQAPQAGDEEPVYPGTCRPVASPGSGDKWVGPAAGGGLDGRGGRDPNWRFRVPDGERVEFEDGAQGRQAYEAAKDFGDFIVWRHDGVPSYQLAVVVDDAAMKITEVVRGADLLVSTARQLLLYQALGLQPPAFFHCPLVTDAAGVRLAKRHDALSLRRLREGGVSAAHIWSMMASPNWEHLISVAPGSRRAKS